MTDQGPQPTESASPSEPASARSDAEPSRTKQPTDVARGGVVGDAPAALPEPAVREIIEQYRYSDEAREALLGSILRMVDEHRFGHRELSTEEVRDLSEAWSALNDGLTGTEVGYNWTIRRLHARRSESRRHD